MEKKLEIFFQEFDGNLSPIKDQAVKYLDSDSTIDEEGSAIIFRRPWIAPQNFGLRIFPPTSINYFSIFKDKCGFDIPEIYVNILLKMNGCFIYDFNLFGLPNSIYMEGFLNRKISQPLDLQTANIYWKNVFQVNSNFFYFGGRAYNFDENVGYFLDQENNILSYLKSRKLINSWQNFSEFLKEEILEAEKMMIDERNEI